MYAGISYEEQFHIQARKCNISDYRETISSNIYIARINFMEDIQWKRSDRRTDATSMSFRTLDVVQMDCKERLKRLDVVLNFVLARERQHFELLSPLNLLKISISCITFISIILVCASVLSLGDRLGDRGSISGRARRLFSSLNKVFRPINPRLRLVPTAFFLRW
jgi:hypothetical protein